MADIKIVLKKSPGDKENGVWIEGQKIDCVQKIEFKGEAGHLPSVVITLIPRRLEAVLGDYEYTLLSPILKDEKEE